MPPEELQKDSFREQRDINVYKELMNELRWRRDQDSRYLTIFFGACSFVFAALFVVLTKSEISRIHHLMLLNTAVIISFIGAACICKIYLEHKEHRRTGAAIVAILDQWKLIDPEPATQPPVFHIFRAEMRNLGKGGGWKQSCLIILVFIIGVWALRWSIECATSLEEHCKHHCGFL